MSGPGSMIPMHQIQTERSIRFSLDSNSPPPAIYIPLLKPPKQKFRNKYPLALARWCS